MTLAELHAGVLAAPDTAPRLDVVTQDDDVDSIEAVGGPSVIRV